MAHASIVTSRTVIKGPNIFEKAGLPALARRIWKYRLSYLFISPFLVCFIIFIAIPVFSASLLAFTYYNAIEKPVFIGWENFRVLFTDDEIFLKYALPNTLKFTVAVGPLGYALSFLVAWLITQIPKRLGTVFTLAVYVPSITGGIMMQVVWRVFFSGDRMGYLNSILQNLGIINSPQLWLVDRRYLINCMIFVSLWASMGIGFLSILAGLKSVDSTLYEAGYIDGIKTKLQEIWYLTIPAIKPQMLFGAVMAVTGTLKAGDIGVQLSGTNPTPDYAGHLIMNHMSDYAYIRYELGYSTAVSLILLLIIFGTSRFCWAIFGAKEDE